MESFDAVGTDFDALAVYLGPLEVGHLAVFAGRIVVAAQKNPGGSHV